MTTERERDDARQGQTRAQGKGPQPRDPKDGAVAHEQIPPEQIATPPAGPPQLGGKQVQAVIGPHAGSVLTMPEAEADQAVADRWANEIQNPPLDPNAQPADPLDQAGQQAAADAANAWAQAQLPQEAKAEPQPPRRANETRDMQAGERGSYETRGPGGAAPGAAPAVAPEPGARRR